MMTYEETKALWAKTDWNNPVDGVGGCHWGDMWDYLYEAKLLPDVIEHEFKFVHFSRPGFYMDGANEDANEILGHMDRHWQDRMIGRWYEAHREEAEQGYNLWWWGNHDIADYMDEEGAL